MIKHVCFMCVSTKEKILLEGEKGFALVEVMFALIIVGILSGVSLQMIKQYTAIRRTQTTSHHQEHILYALGAFLHTYGRLPCPSDPHHLGYERSRCQKPDQFSGIVPFATLGLSKEMAQDGRQNFFIYIVHPQLTLTRNMDEYCQGNLEHLLCVDETENTKKAFDPIAVILMESEKRSVLPVAEKCSSHIIRYQEVKARSETRKKLAAFYGKLFCSPLSVIRP